MRAHIQFYSRLFTIAGGIAALLALTSTGSASTQPSVSQQRANPHPTTVNGDSWIAHLNRGFNETSMGKTGRLGPMEVAGDGATHAMDDKAVETGNGAVVVHGSDLYRMNCRGCHGETGAGAPPEINSVINPVRATSTAAILERVRATGAEISVADAAKLAEQSRNMLLDRIHHGGHDMPAFPHLSEAEINSLLGYLRKLAGVRGAESDTLAVREERVRIGEHIAKSTCHICHGAAGPNPSAQELYYGEIPPLSTLPRRVTRAQFIRKVTQGAPILMGEPAQYLRGRMPVFYYLSEDEAADVYLYLTSYPPDANPMSEAATAVAGAAGPDPGPEAKANVPGGTLPAVPGTPAEKEPANGGSALQRGLSPTALADEQMLILAVLLGLLASMVLCLGFWFSAHELKRLAGGHGVAVRTMTPFKAPATALPDRTVHASSAALLL